MSRGANSIFSGALKAIGVTHGDISGLDLSKEEDRNKLVEILQQLFMLMKEGRSIGTLTPEEFIQLALGIENLTDGVDEAADSFEKLNRELSNVPHGFKLAMNVFRATVGEPRTVRTDPPGIGGGGIPPFATAGAASSYSVGVININTSGGESGAEVVDKIEREMRRRARQGGTSNLDLSRRQY